MSRGGVHIAIAELVICGRRLTAAEARRVSEALQGELARLVRAARGSRSLASSTLVALDLGALPLPAQVSPERLGETLAQNLYDRLSAVSSDAVHGSRRGAPKDLKRGDRR